MAYRWPSCMIVHIKNHAVLRSNMAFMLCICNICKQRDRCEFSSVKLINLALFRALIRNASTEKKWPTVFQNSTSTKLIQT